MSNQLIKINPQYLEIIKQSLSDKGKLLPFVQEVMLLHCNVAGTTFLELDDIEPTLKINQLLAMKRDPQNEHDNNAILIMTETGQKLGYIPRDKNEVLSKLMDAGKLLFGKLIQKSWVENWLKLEIQIYMRDL